MQRGALVTIGTAPANLLSLLRGDTSVSGASVSRNYGTRLNDQCRKILLKCDSGTIYLGPDTTVSSTDYYTKLLAGESITIQDAEADTLNLSDVCLIAAESGAKLSVQFITI